MSAGKPTILLTGFKPWGASYSPSQIVIDRIAQVWDQNGYYSLVTFTFTETYTEAGNVIPLINTYLPFLNLHLSTENTVPNLRLESYARRAGYVFPDMAGYCPPENAANLTGADILNTSFDANKILQNFSSRNQTVYLEPSATGPYNQHEYLYYKALMSSYNRNAIMINVPLFTQALTAEVLENAVRDIMRATIDALGMPQAF